MHERRPQRRRSLSKCHGAGKPILQIMEAIEGARPSPVRQASHPCDERCDKDRRRREREDPTRRSLADGPYLSQRDVGDRHGEGYAKSLGAHTECTAKPNAVLRVTHKPPNSLDSVLVAAHP
jgi:hypothetical protein